MVKTILHDKVYYYEDAVKNFNEVMSSLSELENIYKNDGKKMWETWTASNDKDHIYGDTMSFNVDFINTLDDLYKDKMLFIYKNIMDSFYSVSKDYAESVGDYETPNLFPTFNIKKYYTGTYMGPHFDQLDGDKTLRYSLVMYLNDDFQGGEISFSLKDYENNDEEIKPNEDYEDELNNKVIDFGIKPKAGSIIIFPSSAPYYHTAHLVKTKFKYMVPSHWIHNNMEFHRSM
ncbi:2OG-Fe(II) oxygenase [bacterium]|nr:2OG-Fe(II) oxygenase [bacterium]